MCKVNDRSFLMSGRKIIDEVEFCILFTIVETQDEKYTRIGIQTFDGKVKDEETYHDALEMQDIDYLIDRMAVGLINQLQEKQKKTYG